MYKAITRHHPFWSDHMTCPTEMIEAVLKKNLVWPSNIDDVLLKDIVELMLQKSPVERPSAQFLLQHPWTSLD